jgi:hypothetical protein
VTYLRPDDRGLFIRALPASAAVMIVGTGAVLVARITSAGRSAPV